MECTIDSKRINEFYTEFRQKYVELRCKGIEDKQAKPDAFDFVYQTHKEELHANHINFDGFFKVMEICHTFFCSRGAETAKDFAKEDEIINNSLNKL
jgi:hypothetical protein